MKLGSANRKQFYNLVDQYILDHVDPTEFVSPSRLSDMVALITPEVSVAQVKTVCTNFIYILFYLIRQKRLKVQLPQAFSGVRPRKPKGLDKIKDT